MAAARSSHRLDTQGLTVCADDFGLKPSVDEAILELVGRGRLNAVSCMSGGNSIETSAPRLRAALADAPLPVQIGLHVTLTEYAPVTDQLSFATNGQLPTLGWLMKHCFLGTPDRQALRIEVARQIALFIELFDQPPAFIDGHQHVHLLPAIRDVVIETASMDAPNAWMRSCRLGLWDLVSLPTSRGKAAFLSWLSIAFERRLRRQGIAFNRAFFGVNDFRTDQEFSKLMRHWTDLAARKNDVALIMCHPGKESGPEEVSIPDPIRNRRPQEFAYLASEECAFGT